MQPIFHGGQSFPKIFKPRVVQVLSCQSDPKLHGTTQGLLGSLCGQFPLSLIHIFIQTLALTTLSTLIILLTCILMPALLSPIYISLILLIPLSSLLCPATGPPPIPIPTVSYCWTTMLLFPSFPFLKAYAWICHNLPH